MIRQDQHGVMPQAELEFYPRSHQAIHESYGPTIKHQISGHVTSSASPPPESDPRQAPSRKRVTVACSRCRKRKIKCSGETAPGQGCMNCQQCKQQDSCKFLRVCSTDSPNVGSDQARRYEPYGPPHLPRALPPFSQYHGNIAAELYPTAPSAYDYYGVWPTQAVPREQLNNLQPYRPPGEEPHQNISTSPSYMLPALQTNPVPSTSNLHLPHFPPKVWQSTGAVHPAAGVSPISVSQDGHRLISQPYAPYGPDTQLQSCQPLDQPQVYGSMPFSDVSHGSNRSLPVLGTLRGASNNTAVSGIPDTTTPLSAIDYRSSAFWNNSSTQSNLETRHDISDSFDSANDEMKHPRTKGMKSRPLVSHSPSVIKTEPNSQHLTATIQTSGPKRALVPVRSASHRSGSSTESEEDNAYGYSTVGYSSRQGSGGGRLAGTLIDGQEYTRIPIQRTGEASFGAGRSHLPQDFRADGTQHMTMTSIGDPQY